MDSIMNWMKEFMIIYLILTILTSLAAADQYKKHLHFFSGVILILIFISPALGLLGDSGRLEARIGYESFWKSLDSARQDTKKLEFLQNSHYIAKYEQAIARDMQVQAEAQGLSGGRVQVRLSNDYEINEAAVWLDIPSGADYKAEKKKWVRFLMRTYGLRNEQILVH